MRTKEKQGGKRRLITNFELKPGQTVYAKYGPDAKIVPAEVKLKVSPFVYIVQLSNDRIVKVHRDSLKIRYPVFQPNLLIEKPVSNKHTRTESPNTTPNHPKRFKPIILPTFSRTLRPRKRINYYKT